MKMIHTHIKWNDLSATVGLGSYCPPGSAAEFHAMIELNETFRNTETQYRLLEEAVQRLRNMPELKASTLVWKRFFVSDAINQASYFTASSGEAVSIVQQPPLNGSKAALLLYFVEGAALSEDTDGTIVMKRPDYTHLFHVQLHHRTGDIKQQTDKIFNQYSESLARKKCALKGHCIRTWIYVQDVDVQYAGMVTARKEHFDREGLTNETHYIASTGIEGRYIYPEVLMLMDAYAIAGIKPQQIKYLQAHTHLNPTYEYGVTFERGTAIDYGDRRHVFISGTASINHKGVILHPSDVVKQTARTFENISILLAEADTAIQDVAHLIVYLRDTADYSIVDQYIELHYPNIPRIIIWAPVCRPGWLVEVECMAVKEVSNNQWSRF